MTISRRGFLKGLLAAAIAPVISKIVPSTFVLSRIPKVDLAFVSKNIAQRIEEEIGRIFTEEAIRSAEENHYQGRTARSSYGLFEEQKGDSADRQNSWRCISFSNIGSNGYLD